jgi:hypothetical protein
MVDIDKLDAFTLDYVEAAMEDGICDFDDDRNKPVQWLDHKYETQNISQEWLKTAVDDCAKFQREQAQNLADAYVLYQKKNLPIELAGFHFFHSRAGNVRDGFKHPDGESVWDRLHDAAAKLGPVELTEADMTE